MALSPRTPDLAGLDLLVAIADQGGISAASRQLMISQPTASERLRVLEARLGLTLVRRGRTGSALTAEGTAVVDWARPVLAAAGELVDGTALLRGERRTRLAVSASLTVAEHLVPRWLVGLAGRAPEVSVSLRMGNSSDVAAAVRAGTADLGFVEGVRAPYGLRSRTVCHDELVLIVAPGHPWARRGHPVSPADLEQTLVVMREFGSGTREVLEQWMTATGHEPHPGVVLASTTAIVQAVLGGVGPAVVSALAVREELTGDRLVRIPLSVDTGTQKHSPVGPREAKGNGRAVPGTRHTGHVRLERSIRAIWRGPGRPTPAASELLAVALAP
jgi:DNA-binding transcriptional LysR family regulator